MEEPSTNADKRYWVVVNICINLFKRRTFWETLEICKLLKENMTRDEHAWEKIEKQVLEPIIVTPTLFLSTVCGDSVYNTSSLQGQDILSVVKY